MYALLYDKFKRDGDDEGFNRFISQGIYLGFSGEGIDNIGGMHGFVNQFDAGTKQIIPASKIWVCGIKNQKSGIVLYDGLDFINWSISRIGIEGIQTKMPVEELATKLDRYISDNEARILKFLNPDFAIDIKPISKYVELLKDSVDRVEK